MKKAFKMIFIYLGVILLALVATVIFCAGFLFFYREGNIFGIQYISTDEVIYAKENEDMSELETIEVYSESFEVRIGVNSGVENLIGAMNNEVFGYAKKAKAHTSFGLEYYEDTKTAVFSSTQPKGWLNKRKAFIQIAIPENMATSNVDLVVKTEKADIKIGGDKLLSVGNLVIDTSKGDAKLSNVNIDNSINAIIGKGSVYIDETCKTTNSINAVVSVGSGTVNFAKVNVEQFKLDLVEIKSISKGKIGIRQVNRLETNGNIEGGGKIEIGDVGLVDFESLDTDISIKNINGLLDPRAEKSLIIITGRGDVFVENVKTDLEVDGYNGDIDINVATETVVLRANQGDVRIGNAVKSVAIDTTYGNIDVSFVASEATYTPTNEIKHITATTSNGHIIVKGLQHGLINATDNGRVSLEYDKVVGNNIINAKAGVVNIIVPHSEDESSNEFAFNLKINSEVNCDIKVGVVGELGSIGAVDYGGSGTREFSNIYNFQIYNNI